MGEKNTLTRDSTMRSSSASQSSQQATPQSRRVLVVDDNRDARDSLALLLRGLCCEVTTARDSQSALETAASFLPQVVILDIVMPGVSGFKTAELMRQQAELRDITIISVTGWQEDVDDWLSKHSGCDYHLLKPLDIEALQKILAKHLPA